MRTRSTMAILAVLLLSTCMVFSQNPNSGNPHGQGSLAVPVTGTSQTGGPVTGTFNIQSFAVQNVGGTPTLVAIGNLVATLTDAAGTVQTVVQNNVAAPVASSTGSCSILSLTLGPLHLNLLGLVVDLNQVNLNITAQQGAGNLLGNLLCSVANLLNGGGPLSQIANALNQILAGLGL